MASSDPKTQLAQLIKSMLDEKFLNNYYHELEMLQRAKNPTFIIDILTLACDNSEKLMQHLNYLLSGDNLDYKEIDKYALKLNSSVCSIGAERLVRASQALRRGCSEKIKPQLLATFGEVTQEFLILKSKLEIIIQLEKEILMAGPEVEARKSARENMKTVKN